MSREDFYDFENSRMIEFYVLLSLYGCPEVESHLQHKNAASGDLSSLILLVNRFYGNGC